MSFSVGSLAVYQRQSHIPLRSRSLSSWNKVAFIIS